MSTEVVVLCEARCFPSIGDCIRDPPILFSELEVVVQSFSTEIVLMLLLLLILSQSSSKVRTLVESLPSMAET